MKTCSLILIITGTLGVAGCGSPPIDETVEQSPASLSPVVWEKLLTCDGGTAVLDVNSDERRNLQLVIRDPNIIGYLDSVGVVDPAYNARELVLSGYVAHVDFGSPNGPRMLDYPFGGKGIFDRHDFAEMIANYNYYEGGPFARIFRDGDG